MSTCDTKTSGPGTGGSTGTNGQNGRLNGGPAKTSAQPSRPFAADKIFAHKDRVEQWLESGKSAPVTFEIDLANACNQKCPHCFGFYPERDQAKMCLDEAKRIIQQIKEIGARGITFTGGGDPLVNPAAMDAIRFAKESGLDVGFITNGQALNEESCDAILKTCVWTRISVDAATPEIFFKTHGMGARSFEVVLENIRLLVRRKRELGSATTVGIGFLTSNETEPDIYSFAALGQELGVDYAQYRPLLRRMGEEEIDYSSKRILDEMLRAQDEFSNDVYRVVCSEHKYRRIEAGKTDRPYKKCYGQHFAAVVAADQKMYVCCHMRGVEKYAIGDLSSQSLEEIWNSEKRQKIADTIDFKDCPPLCRCDSFNEILWDLKDGGRDLKDAPTKKEWQHKNFI